MVQKSSHPSSKQGVPAPAPSLAADVRPAVRGMEKAREALRQRILADRLVIQSYVIEKEGYKMVLYSPVPLDVVRPDIDAIMRHGGVASQTGHTVAPCPKCGSGLRPCLEYTNPHTEYSRDFELCIACFHVTEWVVIDLA